MDLQVTTRIDADKCTGCGRCVAICPLGTLSLQGQRAAVTGEQSLSCGHCAAVCPEEAITVGAIDTETSRFTTFTGDPRCLPEGVFDTAQLVRLMASRRSCRNFLERPVPPALLEDLVKIGITAPSGSNSQAWTFTLLPDRKAIVAFGDQVVRFFRRLNRLAVNALVRNGLRIMGQKELSDYHRVYRQSVTEILDEWERTGRDRLFHGATAAIIVGSKPGGSNSKEDALLATQNILLAAHSLGLGSCLIGFAVVPLAKDIRIKRYLEIPDSERVHAVIALGYPDECYLRQAGRKAFVQRVFNPPQSPEQ